MDAKTYVLDTSFISALIDIDDLHFEEAMRSFSLIDESSVLVVPAIVLAELVMSKNRKPILKYSDIFYILGELSVDIFYPIEHHFQAFHDFIEEHEIKGKSSDILVLFEAFRRRCRLITFDQQLKNQHQQLSRSL